MPRFLLAFLLLLATTPAALAQTLVRQALPLRAVTLYLPGAELHHEGSLPLPAGAVDVRLSGLSPRLSPGSVQATASGATLEGVETVAARPLPPDTLRRLRRQEATLLAEKEFLTQNARLTNPAPGHWLDEMQRGAAYYSQRLSQVAERLASVQARLQKGSAPAPAAAALPTDLLLHLTVPRAGAVRLSVTYQVQVKDDSTYTAWQPAYELRVREDDPRHLLAVSSATLYNGTGLPWAQVPVTLRTTTPTASLARPSLDPWTVDFGEATSEGEGNLSAYAVKGPGTAGTPGSAPAEAPGLGTALRLPLPVTLAPAATQTYRLAEYTLPLRLEYLAVPKKEDDVFLVGRVADWNQVGFLAETATVFYRGTYVGETTLDTRAYSDTLEVALGRDPQVQLTRTKRVDVARTSIGHETTELGYEINVKNTHPYPVRVRLLDQVPVAQDKAIEVKVLDIGGAALEEASGKLTWLFSLPAGASRKFPIAFTVEARARRSLNLRLDRRIKNPKFR